MLFFLFISDRPINPYQNTKINRDIFYVSFCGSKFSLTITNKGKKILTKYALNSEKTLH